MYKRWDYNELYKFTRKAERLTLQGNFKEVIPMMKELFQGFYEAQDIIDIFVSYIPFITDLTEEDFEHFKEISSFIQIRELLTDKEYLCGSKMRIADFFRGFFAQNDDIYSCIMHGYYSVDDESWLRRITDFFDAVNIIINYTIDDFDEYGEYFLYNYEFALEFFNSNEYPYRFYVANNQLEIYAFRSIGTGIIKTYDGFTLNVKRILEDKAYIYDFFREHFKQDYKEEDKKKIIEQLHRYNEVKTQFPLDDLL